MIVPRHPRGGREPAVNVPPLLLVFLALLTAIHAGRALLDDEGEARLFLLFAFFPAPWTVAAGGATPADVLAATAGDREVRETLARIVLANGVQPWSAVTYALLHGSWTHLGLNAVWFVAFGTAVVRRAGAARSIVLALVGAGAGAGAQWLVDRLGVSPMIGASAVVSAFMGAAATFMFRPPPAWASEGRPAPERRWDFVGNRTVLGFLAAWLVVNLLFGFVAVPLGLSDAPIAWEAHIGGLAAGLLVFPFLDPGSPPNPPAFGIA